MSPEAVLSRVREFGVVVQAEGGRLRYSGSKDAVTAVAAFAQKNHKPELLAVLARETGLRGSGWRPWKPESDADIAEAVKEAKDERAAILEFEGGLRHAEAQAGACAWHWKSDKYDPVTGAYGGTYICPHADAETVRHELEAQFGGRVTELQYIARTGRGTPQRKVADGYERATPSTA